VKPDNILVNWTCDKDGNKTVTDVALGDFDIAFKSKGRESRQTPYTIGNAMWRSLEGQTGRGVTRASDIFSFGLVVGEPCINSKIHTNLRVQCIYALGGAEFLLIKDY
jgi:serine/threonine protein kinase